MRALRPCRWPASRMARDSSGVNTPCSQNTSHHSASPSAAIAGIISSITRRTYSLRRPRYSTGTSCAPMNVAVRSMGWPADSGLDRAQHAALGLELEAVAALGLGGGGAEGEHLGQPRPREIDQLVLARRARGRHGFHDAAATGRDLGVGGAGETAPQLVTAIAGEHEMRVRIDEARHDRAALAVDHLRVGGQRDRLRRICRRTDEDDAAFEAGDGGIGERADLALRGATARAGSRAGGHEVGIVDQEVSLHRRRLNQGHRRRRQNLFQGRRSAAEGRSSLQK